MTEPETKAPHVGVNPIITIVFVVAVVLIIASAVVGAVVSMHSPSAEKNTIMLTVLMVVVVPALTVLLTSVKAIVGEIAHSVNSRMDKEVAKREDLQGKVETQDLEIAALMKVIGDAALKEEFVKQSREEGAEARRDDAAIAEKAVIKTAESAAEALERGSINVQHVDLKAGSVTVEEAKEKP